MYLVTLLRGISAAGAQEPATFPSDLAERASSWSPSISWRNSLHRVAQMAEARVIVDCQQISLLVSLILKSQF